MSVPNERQTPRIQRGLALGRLNNFIDKYNGYSGINLNSVLDTCRITFSEDWAHLTVYSVPDLKRISFKEATREDNLRHYRKARIGEWFGPSWVEYPSSFFV